MERIMDPKHLTLTATIKIRTAHGRQAVEELGLHNMVQKQLHPEVALSVARLIEDRAYELEREAEERKREQALGKS